MTAQTSCLRDFTRWALMLGISLAGIPVAQATGPDGPVRPLDPALVERMQKDLEKAEREYLARPKSVPQIGIIFGDVVGEQFGSSYLIENMWREILNGEEVRVYAGSMRINPAGDAVKYDPFTVHGFVIIQKGVLGKPNMRANKLYTPIAVGSLRIIAAKGSVLTLQSRQGNKFLLNVETEQLTPLGAH